MKVALTGASGYVGSCISNGLRNHGHEVLAFSRRSSQEPWISYALGDDPANLPWDKVDTLIHAAYDFTPHSWQAILTKNVRPSIDLFHAAKEAGVPHLVFISSMSAFGGCRSNYGKAKLLIEEAVLKLGATVIRPGLVWGGRSGGVMGALENLVRRLPIVPFLTGGGGLSQYLVHETDLSEAVVAVTAEGPVAGGALYSMANPSSLPLLEILKSIARRSKRSRVYLPVPWQVAMAGLRTFEMLGIHPPFRGDSLIGLVYRAPVLQQQGQPPRIEFRPFN